MNRKRLAIIAGAAVVVAAAAYLLLRAPTTLTLTGIVTTNDVIVSPQVAGQVSKLLVTEGDSVAANQLLAVLSPAELAADQSFYARTAQAAASQVQASESELKFEETQAAEQLRQARANLASALAQASEDSASAVNMRRILTRYEAMASTGGISPQQLDSARTAYTVVSSRLDASRQQVQAQQAAVALARAAEDQVAMKRSGLAAARQQQAAASAQTRKADVRLELHRDPRADRRRRRRARGAGRRVRERRPADRHPHRTPTTSGSAPTSRRPTSTASASATRSPCACRPATTRTGTVFYRGVDAGYATQRDVSRTKRDIKTFEIRLRVDNSDRRLAVGMTAYVLLPVKPAS